MADKDSIVGLVIVSHSATLAAGVHEIASEMTQEPVPIIAVGGIDDPQHPLGSDAAKVYEALESLAGQPGVVIFYDIGSTKLNAELAMDMISPELRERVWVCDAPLVEGVLTAVVEAAAGAAPEQIIAAAKQSAAPAEPVDAPADAVPTDPEQLAGYVTRDYTLRNRLGLHARPAAQLVALLRSSSAPVYIRNVSTGAPFADAASLNSILHAQATGGNTVRLAIGGGQPESLHKKIAALIDSAFGEEAYAPPQTAPPDTAGATAAEPVSDSQPDTPAPALESGAVIHGTVIAPGFAIGQVRWYRQISLQAERTPVSDSGAEVQVLAAACRDAGRELQELLQGATAVEQDTLQVQIAFLEDPDIIGKTEQDIRKNSINAAGAWGACIRATMQSYQEIRDPLFRARAEDIGDLGRRVLRILTARNSSQPAAETEFPDEPVVLCLDTLDVSMIPLLRNSRILACCTVAGEPASHAAILTASFQIPIMFMCGEKLQSVDSGKVLAVDGTRGTGGITYEPSERGRARFDRRRKQWAERHAVINKRRRDPAHTRDGVPVAVYANIALPDEARQAVEAGADGVGLFRSEFLYMNRPAAPDEEEQYQAYRGAVDALQGKPLTIRTMDIGGDKEVPYLHREAENNPNLGVRGIRYSLADAALFRQQLRAIVRCARDTGQVQVMLPLITNAFEVEAARTLLQECIAEVSPEGVSLPLGIMIETPAAALCAPALAGMVDFFSIGSNDLTQYIMATDRNNRQLASYSDSFHPAVLRAVRAAARAADDAGIACSICGNMASVPAAATLLVGLGIRKVSVTARSIPEIKYQVAGIDTRDASALADDALRCSSAQEVHRLLEDHETPL